MIMYSIPARLYKLATASYAATVKTSVATYLPITNAEHKKELH